ncbi:nickel pincer cofactor biosynthesis protein LarB [Enterovibrio sp. 27052020O]|uniref:nickel pincer cofactor biosynthesis protein LarB n=1 Tax=Enterovibrio sp. 27052020O TaxID=3241166 RepID=UPI00388DB8ED
MHDIMIDFERRARCGVEEAIYCESKSVEQIEAIITMMSKRQARALFTRLNQTQFDQLTESAKAPLTYHPIACIATMGAVTPLSLENAPVAIVSGGASDQAVCHEISLTLNYHGIAAVRIEDVGVSALWRLEARLDDIKKAKIIIAVAGMEAALPTVLSGLIANPIIAVPTSVGYGVASGGHLALNACLGSCAAGLMTVNIDNGFGAACAAIKLLNQFEG